MILRRTRIVSAKKLRRIALSRAHDGHLEIISTAQNYAVQYGGLRNLLWVSARENEASLDVSWSVTPPREPIRTTTLPTGPWRDFAVDLLGPLLIDESILVVVDCCSGTTR